MIYQLRLPNALKNMLEHGKAVHSVGIEGSSIGNALYTAYTYSAGIMCKESLPCGQCDSCRKIFKRMHRDVRLLDTASGSFTKANIRQIKADAYISPIEGTAKIYIVNCTDGIPRDVQSLLLKIIEEPPDNTYFIFLTSSRGTLLPTIVSRIVWVKCIDIGVDECVSYLSLAYSDVVAVKRATILAGCDLELAEKLLENADILEKYEVCVSVVLAIASGKVYDAVKLLVPFEKDRKTYATHMAIMLKLLTASELMAELSISGQGILDINTALREATTMLDVAVQLRAITILLANACV